MPRAILFIALASLAALVWPELPIANMFVGPTQVGVVRRVAPDPSAAPRISSTKSLSGHSLGAAGVQEAIYSLLMMEGDFIAASANIENLDEAAQSLPIVRQRVDGAGLQRGMSNSFGFGGTNASLVFQRFAG